MHLSLHFNRECLISKVVLVFLGFWKDLISENGEASLQRLQIVFWTLLLGVIFLRAVWDTLAMPQYDATLLGLMTISSGTYLSSKLPCFPFRNRAARNRFSAGTRFRCRWPIDVKISLAKGGHRKSIAKLLKSKTKLIVHSLIVACALG